MTREKIAILGAGPSGLTTAYWLTSTPELRAKYEVTIYQMGWRVGGKGRSGRGEHGRIEEHGLHIMFGFYQNFFTMIRNVYDELGRPPNHPLATWREAFAPHDFGVVEDFYNGQWLPWWLQFPGNPAIPGQGGAALNGSRDYLLMVLQGAVETVFGPRAEEWFDDIIFPRGKKWEHAADKEPPFSGKPDAGVRLAITLLKQSLAVAKQVGGVINTIPLLVDILKRLRQLAWGAMRNLAKANISAYRFWMGVDFIVALGLAVIGDAVFEPGGWDRIDQYDFRQWLQSHGAHDESLQSPYVRTIYDAAFSYAGGDPTQQRCSASAALRALIRMGFTYKGAAYYKMQSGMGDVIIMPLYLALKKRGVQFKLFHKVEELRLSEDGTQIGSVRINVQAKVREGLKEYNPVVMVKGLECWTAEPDYEQLEDPEKLKNVDLESYYADWKGYGDTILEAGKDFDKVVLATPVACLPFICSEILDTNPRWKQMVDHVKAVQTLAFQLWFKKDLKELGWEMPPPLLSLFVEPLNTWSDMSQVLPTEDWSGPDAPKSVSYFCGPQLGPDPMPPASDHAFPDRMTENAKRTALDFMRQNLTTLLKDAVNPSIPPEVDWDVLVAPPHLQGEARFDEQYWRSNCDPAERCTVALPGATRYRIRADSTGYPNLVVAGDWIDNGLYVACLEGAVQGGIYSARAVASEKFPIIGEELLPPMYTEPMPQPVRRQKVAVETVPLKIAAGES